MGWYTYEQKNAIGKGDYPDDTIDISGHDRAAIVTWRGINTTERLDETAYPLGDTTLFLNLDATFSALEKNYREFAEIVTF